MKVVDVTGYSPANQKTCELLGAAAVRAPARHDTHYYDSIKYWQTPVSPTNQQQWVDAWSEVTG